MKNPSSRKAIFAAGCFWGVQHYFDQVPGVEKTVAERTGRGICHVPYEPVK